MFRVVCVYEFDRFVDRVDGADGAYVIEKLKSEVFVLCAHDAVRPVEPALCSFVFFGCGFQNRIAHIVRAELRTAGQFFFKQRQKIIRDFFIDQNTFDRIARAGTLKLCVFGNRRRRFRVRRFIDIEVTHAASRFDDRHARVLHDILYERFAAARNHDIDFSDGVQNLRNVFAAFAFRKFDRFGNARFLQSVFDRANERFIRFERGRRSAQQNRIAAFVCETKCVHGNVRPRFVDDRRDAEWNAHLPYPHTVRCRPAGDDFAHGIFLRDDDAHTCDDIVYFFIVERKPFDKRARHTRLFGTAHVERVRRKERGAAGIDAGGNGKKCAVFLRGGLQGKFFGSSPEGSAYVI